MATALGADAVHLWRAPVDVSPDLAARLASTLSENEKAQAARLRRPEDRSRYVSAHGWLRHLLAGYLDASPALITFVAGDHGKPRLEDPLARWLRFNMSHTAGLVAFAVARDREVGVDVEEIRDDVEIDGISRRMFSAEQCRELDALPPPARAAAFFATWTRNEAYVKAAGTGLGGAERGVDAPQGWSVKAFDAGPGYAAAVAVEGGEVEIPLVATQLEG